MQAILLLAHKEMPLIKELTQKLSKSFEVYIHFDTKMQLSAADEAFLKEHKIHYISEVKVNWGSWSIGEATVRLMRLALKNPAIDYFHIISGQDWVAANVEELYQHFENDSKIYMVYEKAAEVKKNGEPIIWWQKYYFNYDRVNRRSMFGKIYHRLLISMQTLLRVDKFKRLGIKEEIYAGANWADLPRDAVEYCLEYLESHPKFLQMLKTGCFSDEFWMQTIICNEPCFKERLLNENYRYIKWEEKHGSYPAILDEENLAEIQQGDYFFIRKVEAKYSSELLRQLDRINKN
ncbi:MULTISPECIES: beta-1,6-N-acetylglucosaminyltransferase [Ligilactobacillus]|uniref:beta-1,6-N-acetylglucosaminyltransferase n=1 Tax=Ligilactobacillus TaxID=2767887 RepID=UPI00096E3D21|nr:MULTISPECIES: beta-1,6-N-acetylglucosaminyltransferase [Ligilactobacillus]MDU1487464.1 beta-1,6-N-acetylglucosaminyltransferase [Ligilactobacillus animalis]HAB48823.1 glycosyltransferase [Lactobacillus sp.]HAP23401.1 glycosyltransferase [Lactobacillus sp.]